MTEVGAPQRVALIRTGCGTKGEKRYKTKVSGQVLFLAVVAGKGISLPSTTLTTLTNLPFFWQEVGTWTPVFLGIVKQRPVGGLPSMVSSVDRKLDSKRLPTLAGDTEGMFGNRLLVVLVRTPENTGSAFVA